MKYGFIGCGNMGGALAQALSAATKDIMLSDSGSGRAKVLAEKYGLVYGSNEEIAKNCERIFLGVKPQMMRGVLLEISPFLRERKPLLITMAAGLTMQTITEMAETELPVIRIMPNTPVAVGKGVILYCTNVLADKAMVDSLKEDLQSAGAIVPLAEHLIDAGCSLSGCGPAFVYMFIEALADGAVSCGLTRDDAIRFAAMTVAGSAEMVLKTGEHPEKLKDNVCSPGGSTIAGVKSLEDNKFRASASDAVIAAYRRNKELGKA